MSDRRVDTGPNNYLIYFIIKKKQKKCPEMHLKSLPQNGEHSFQTLVS